MKYRVRVDLSFDKEADAQSLMAYARNLSGRAVSINESMDNEEISFSELEICRHDESPPRPCTRLERVEIRKLLPE